METIVDFDQDWSKPAMLGSMKDQTARKSPAMAFVPRLYSAFAWPRTPRAAIEQQPTTAPSSNPAAPAELTPLSQGDKKFIMKVARSSPNEVALSRPADSRASNPDVKSFAQMMITDHTQANSDLGYP